MTEQLKTLMERAATQDFAAVDLDAITSARRPHRASAAGRQRRRRRRRSGRHRRRRRRARRGRRRRRRDVRRRPVPHRRADVDRGQRPSTRPTRDLRPRSSDVLTFVRTSEGIVFFGSVDDDARRLGRSPATR